MLRGGYTYLCALFILLQILAILFFLSFWILFFLIVCNKDLTKGEIQFLRYLNITTQRCLWRRSGTRIRNVLRGLSPTHPSTHHPESPPIILRLDRCPESPAFQAGQRNLSHISHLNVSLFQLQRLISLHFLSEDFFFSLCFLQPVLPSTCFSTWPSWLLRGMNFGICFLQKLTKACSMWKHLPGIFHCITLVYNWFLLTSWFISESNRRFHRASLITLLVLFKNFYTPLQYMT